MEQLVLVEKHYRTGYIILNRPEKRNALSVALINRLKAALQELIYDEKIKIIVIKSSGKAFCAGADLDYIIQMRNNNFEENLRDSQNLRELFDLIFHCPKICIAQVQGPALAGGCGLATVCDFCFATPDAVFGYTEARIGFIPALVMVYLQNKISATHTRELLLTGDILSAEKALQIGLINQVIDNDKIEKTIAEFAEKLCESVSDASVAMIKEMLVGIQGKNFSEALEYAARMNAGARETEDCKRGMEAFLNKEKITW